MYVNFGTSFRGKSSYFTSDERLAEKIRAHRWFREGRIREMPEEEIKEREPDVPSVHPAPPNHTYSILGKRIVSVSQDNEPNTPEVNAGEENPPCPEEGQCEGSPKQEHDTEGVSSFLEAKEFFEVNYGVSRTQCKSKDDLYALCKEHNVTFPNYPLQ